METDNLTYPEWDLTAVKTKISLLLFTECYAGVQGISQTSRTPSTDNKLIIDVYKGLKKKERSFTCLIKAVAGFNAYIKIYRVKQKQMKNAFSRRRLGLCTAGFIIANWYLIQ